MTEALHSRSLTDANLERVLRLTAGPHLDPPVWWRLTSREGGGETLIMLADCSDVFSWGCADASPIGDVDVDLLEASVSDAEAAAPGRGLKDGVLLYCARTAQMRPQGAMYPHLHSATWHLFDDAGPVRDTGLGNPHAHPKDREGVTGAENVIRPVDPDTPVLPCPGVELADEPLTMSDIRRLLVAFSDDSWDSLRWIIDEAGRLRIFVVAFGSFSEDERGCEAAEVTPSNLYGLLDSLVEARQHVYRLLVDDHVRATFISAQRGLVISDRFVQRQDEFTKMAHAMTGRAG